MVEWSEDRDPVAALWRRRGRLVRLRQIAIAGLLALLCSTLMRVRCVAALWRGEVDLTGDRTYTPPHPVDTKQLHGIDHARVHAELLPAWIIAVGREARGLAHHREESTFAALHDAIEADPNLAEILHELRALIRARDEFEGEPERALYLTWAWSHYLDQHALPYQIHGNVHFTRWGPMLSAMVYLTNDDVVVWVGTTEYRVRLGSRIDGTNARELYLGAAGHDGAIAVTDRIAEFAMTDLWPLLDANVDDMLDERRPFAPGVRAEAEQRLGADDFELLRRTAYSRWQLVTTVAAVHRRSSCGSTFRINSVPWDGMDEERLGRLRGFASRSAERSCPAITPEEVELIEVASGQLQRTPDLGHAVGALVAWATEHVAIHETRHLADAQAVSFHDPLPCASCPETMGVQARSELSGYLASIAWSPSPTTAMYQACRAMADDQRLRGGALPEGPHAEAMQLLHRRVGPFCRVGPPQHVAQLGRRLEHEMLGRSDPMRLIELPSRVPVE